MYSEERIEDHVNWTPAPTWQPLLRTAPAGIRACENELRGAAGCDCQAVKHEL